MEPVESYTLHPLYELALRDENAAFAYVLSAVPIEMRKKKWHCNPVLIRALARLGRPADRRDAALAALTDSLEDARQLDNPVGLAAAAITLGLLGDGRAGEALAAMQVKLARSSSHEHNIAAGSFSIALAILRHAGTDRECLRAELAGDAGQLYWAQHAYASWLLDDLAGAHAVLASAEAPERARRYAEAAIHDASVTEPREHQVFEIRLRGDLEQAHDPDADDDRDDIERAWLFA